MAQNTDVIIVGGGLMGLSSAYWLTKKRCSVLVLEKNSGVAMGSGGATDGYIINNTKMPGYHTTLGLSGSEMYPEILDDLGTDCGYTKNCGAYLLCDNDREYEMLKEAARKQRDGGLDIRMINSKELRQLEPNISPDIRGASYTPGGGKIEPFDLIFAYARKALERGARVICDSTVRKVIIKGGKAVGVSTDKGDFYGGAIVDAAGSWSGFLGIAAGLYVPVKPRRGQIVVTERIAPLINGPFSGAGFFCAKFYPEMMKTFRKRTMEFSHSCSMEQSSSGAILIGSTNEWKDFDSRNSQECIEWLVAEACRVVPALKNVHFIRSFTGFRPATPDYLPVLGPTSCLQNYYHITGFEGGGFSLNTVCGRLLSEIICGEEPFMNWEPIGPDRLVKPLEEATAEEIAKYLPVISKASAAGKEQ